MIQHRICISIDVVGKIKEMNAGTMAARAIHKPKKEVVNSSTNRNMMPIIIQTHQILLVSINTPHDLLWHLLMPLIIEFYTIYSLFDINYQKILLTNHLFIWI